MSEDVPQDISEDPAMLAEAGRATGDGGMPPLADTREFEWPAPEISGLVDEVERRRVQEALFGGTSQSFELGRYVITGTLGRGGMGVVFKAFDPELDRRVALKVLHAELDVAHTTRLRREAQAMAKLSHPNVVQVYEVGHVEGQTFVAMELVDGRTLEEWMQREPRPSWRECVEVFVQVGRGLAAAHEEGLVHRDFKPGNAIIDDKGRARVLDFGLARQAADVEGEGGGDVPAAVQLARTDRQQVVPLDVSLTRTGAVLGTPAYMPPEQMMGYEADARSDQFSFSVALYEALYGERPFEGVSMAGLVYSVLRGNVRPVPKGSTVPKTLHAIVLRGLAIEPEDRWPSMEAQLDQLQGVAAPRARRGVVLGLVLGLVGLGAALAVPQFLAMQERCSGARAQLDGVWDDAHRQEVREAIVGTELSFAPDTWEFVAAELDDYAGAWAAAHTEVCEATTVRHEQTEDAMSLRMGCLQEHRTALVATVEVLASADAVQNAADLVVGLPDLARCDDVARLEQQRERMPPPKDSQVAEQVRRLRDQLAGIEAMNHAGKYAETLPQVASVVEQAETLGYGPLLAEATYWRGEILGDDGQYAEAEQALERAHALALEHEHDEIELHVAQRLTDVVGVLLARPDEGKRWGRMAVALAKRSGEDLELALSLNNVGLVLGGAGEYEPAKEHHRRALELREKALGPEHRSVAHSLNNLGMVLNSLGEYEEAKAHLQRATRIGEEALGAEHPHVATVVTNLGAVFYEEGKYEEAERHYRRALQIREAALGAEHPDVADSLSHLGNVFHIRGELEQAQSVYQRALRTSEEALGPEHPDVARFAANLGGVFLAQGEYEPAELHLKRALEIYEKTLGAEHPDVAKILYNLGIVFITQEEYEQAKPHLKRALEINEKTLGAEHPDLAFELFGLGGMFTQLGEYEQAESHFRRALRIWEKALGADHPLVSFPLVGLSGVALEQGELTTAVQLAERALAIREAATVKPHELAEARFVLALALWSDPAQRARARRIAEQTRDVYAELGKPAEPRLAEVETWLAEHRVPRDPG